LKDKIEKLLRAKEQGFDIDTIWYHVTNNKIESFDINKTQDSCIWLTKDEEATKNGTLGAAGSNIILKCYIRSQKLASWDEYDQFNIDQLIQKGFDGALLDDDVMLFYPEQIRGVDAAFLPENFNSTHLIDIEDLPKKENIKNSKIIKKKR
jgi:hypothetical protein